MAENKWQHFVPQFYFKYFSIDSKNICGYYLKGKKLKSVKYGGPVKNYGGEHK